MLRRLSPMRGLWLVNRLAALLLCCSATGAAAETARPDPAALERLVLQDCGSCHGLTLKGGLGPDLRPETISHYDAETLRGVILDGIPGTPMPPWRPLLSEAEAAWIADYLLKEDAQ